MGQFGTSNEIYQGHKELATYPECQWKRRTNIVVYVSFAVHINMIGHTGGGLPMGRGFTIFSSTKQNLNTKSSTETNVVEADEFIPVVLWTRYWL